MVFEKYNYCYLFVGFLFLGITAGGLFSDGMFLDGLLYADISRNMANGLGSFWTPYFSQGLFTEFYEHPPLALGLQSVAFKLFGDSIYVERFYSLFTFIIVGVLIILIWGKLTNDEKNGWIPLFFWIIVNSVSWAAANNMLENTMSIFVCAAVLFYLYSLDGNRFLWILLSGVALSLGVLTKGFFCLYIWSVPFFFWLFKQEKKFVQMVIDTIALISATIFPIALLYFFIPAAQNNMLTYFNKQVVGSIQNVQTVGSRFAILSMFLQNIIAPLIVASIVIMVALKKKIQKGLFSENLKEALMLLSIVLSGILPIMISMKQRGFYIMTVYPLFALALAFYLHPILSPAIEQIKTNTKGFKIFKIVTAGLIVTSIVLSFSQISKVGRDHDVIYDSKAVIEVVGKNAVINICSNMYAMWNLHGYFSRYGNVSLDKTENSSHKYYLSLGDCNKEFLKKNYDLVPIELKQYKIHKLKEQ